jgi:hypothetical protein
VQSALGLYNEDYLFGCWLNQLRVAVVRSWKVVTEAEDR